VIVAFLWGLFAASSLVLGALVVFIRVPSNRTLGLIMGFGSGVLISAVSFELVEEATKVGGGAGAVAAGFFLGAIVFTLGDLAIGRMGHSERKAIGRPMAASGLAIVLGAVLDGIPESAVLGLTLLQTGNIGIAMLVAVFISNLPESIAASDGLLGGGWPRRRVLWLWIVVAVVAGVAAAVGYAVLDGVTGSVLALVLAFAGGAILTMLATSMVPEAFEHGGRGSGLTTVLGFAVAYGIEWLAVSGSL
jgi:ZIP family zinc transporter